MSAEDHISIQGTLLMLDDATPHVTVPVQAIRDGEVVATMLSDERGGYRFINLRPGIYQVRCQTLGGYVYYGEEKVRGPEQPIRLSAHMPISLRVEQDETLKNIDFCFAAFKKGTWKNYIYLDGLAESWVRTVYCDPDGAMWFGTIDGVSRYDGNEFINIAAKDGLAGNLVSAICRDPDGVMWFGTSGGVSRYDGKTFVNLTTEDGLPHKYVNAIHRDPDGVMWFGTNGGVSRYDGKEFVNLTAKDGLANNSVAAIHRDPDGVMWFGTEGGVSRYDGRTFVNFTKKDGMAGNDVLSIHRDPDGAMWFGTWGSGVSRYDSEQFISFTTRDGLAANEVAAIHRDPDGTMWFGTGFRMSEGGVSRYDGKVFVNLTTADGLVDNRIGAIHRDPDGVMWFGTEGGISRYDGKEFVNFTTEDGLTENRVRAIYRDPNGIMWFGTGFFTSGGGVSRYDGREFVNFTKEDGLPHNSVAGMYRDPDGVMWFATGGGGVSQYDGKEFVNLTTADGLVDDRVWAIHRDPDGVMWFGTEGGISRYDGKEFINFTTEDGLAHNAVSAIHRDPNGAIWFATENGGVSGYDDFTWTSLDTRDGLAGNLVESILQDPDGFLWFAALDGGVTRYRPSTTPPRVYIVSVTTDQTYRDVSDIPTLTPGTRVTIGYNSIDLKTLPEKRQYRCRVEELDSDWRKPTKATLFDYTFDQPGTYTFEVQAIDRDLNYSEPASIELEVIPDPRNHRIIQLEEHIRQQELAEIERVHQELENARQIQQSLLPTEAPEVQGFEIAGSSIPAKEVSGDFYSYLSLGDSVGIVLADVTGKSVKAAMVAALASGTLSAEIKGRTEFWDSPSKILSELNTDLQPHLIRGMYTAMSLSIIQPQQKRLIFSNAGMPYPIVKRSNEVWELEVNVTPLGLMSGAEYEDLSIYLEAGDFVVFCSDGVIEAENQAEEMYQSERLLRLIQQADPGLSAQEMVDLVVKNVAAFTGDVDQSDDTTVVVLWRRE